MVTRAARIGPAVAKAVKAAQLGDQDAAAIALARHYAALVDDGEQAAGLRLLRVLDSLGLTPAGRRISPAKGGTPDAAQPDNALAALRRQWGPSARRDRAATLHAVSD